MKKKIINLNDIRNMKKNIVARKYNEENENCEDILTKGLINQFDKNLNEIKHKRKGN